MKKLLPILLIFFSCNKETVEPQVKELNKCSLGVTELTVPSELNLYSDRIKTVISKFYFSFDAVIFLDFDGHTVKNTSWNWGGDLVCAPANISQNQIQQIRDSISYDYSPYKITVTTDSTLFNKASKKQRVVFTTDWQWFGTAGGASFTGSFKWGDDTPCFVFVSLLQYNTQFIRYAASHEAGHTIGLRHIAKYTDCVLIDQYNPNKDNNGFAYIMGNPNKYGYPARFGIGPTPYGCNNIQNDPEIIASVVGYR